MTRRRCACAHTRVTHHLLGGLVVLVLIGGGARLVEQALLNAQQVGGERETRLHLPVTPNSQTGLYTRRAHLLHTCAWVGVSGTRQFGAEDVDIESVVNVIRTCLDVIPCSGMRVYTSIHVHFMCDHELMLPSETLFTVFS